LVEVVQAAVEGFVEARLIDVFSSGTVLSNSPRSVSSASTGLRMTLSGTGGVDLDGEEVASGPASSEVGHIEPCVVVIEVIRGECVTAYAAPGPPKRG
jgi:hypothetical protein